MGFTLAVRFARKAEQHGARLELSPLAGYSLCVNGAFRPTKDIADLGERLLGIISTKDGTVKVSLSSTERLLGPTPDLIVWCNSTQLLNPAKRYFDCQLSVSFAMEADKLYYLRPVLSDAETLGSYQLRIQSPHLLEIPVNKIELEPPSPSAPSASSSAPSTTTNTMSFMRSNLTDVLMPQRDAEPKSSHELILRCRARDSACDAKSPDFRSNQQWLLEVSSPTKVSFALRQCVELFGTKIGLSLAMSSDEKPHRAHLVSDFLASSSNEGLVELTDLSLGAGRYVIIPYSAEAEEGVLGRLNVSSLDGALLSISPIPLWQSVSLSSPSLSSALSSTPGNTIGCPMFSLTFKKNAVVEMVLRAKPIDPRSSIEATVSMRWGLSTLSTDQEGKSPTLDARQFFDQQGLIGRSEVCGILRASAGEKFNIFPTDTDFIHSDFKYELCIYCENTRDVELALMGENLYHFECESSYDLKTIGGSMEHPTWKNNPQFCLNIPMSLSAEAVVHLEVIRSTKPRIPEPKPANLSIVTTSSDSYDMTFSYSSESPAPTQSLASSSSANSLSGSSSDSLDASGSHNSNLPSNREQTPQDEFGLDAQTMVGLYLFQPEDTKLKTVEISNYHDLREIAFDSNRLTVAFSVPTHRKKTSLILSPFIYTKLPAAPTHFKVKVTLQHSESMATRTSKPSLVELKDVPHFSLLGEWPAVSEGAVDDIISRSSRSIVSFFDSPATGAILGVFVPRDMDGEVTLYKVPPAWKFFNDPKSAAKAVRSRDFLSTGALKPVPMDKPELFFPSEKRVDFAVPEGRYMLSWLPPVGVHGFASCTVYYWANGLRQIPLDNETEKSVKRACAIKELFTSEQDYNLHLLSLKKYRDLFKKDLGLCFIGLETLIGLSNSLMNGFLQELSKATGSNPARPFLDFAPTMPTFFKVFILNYTCDAEYILKLTHAVNPEGRKDLTAFGHAVHAVDTLTFISSHHAAVFQRSMRYSLLFGALLVHSQPNDFGYAELQEAVAVSKGFAQLLNSNIDAASSMRLYNLQLQLLPGSNPSSIITPSRVYSMEASIIAATFVDYPNSTEDKLRSVGPKSQKKSSKSKLKKLSGKVESMRKMNASRANYVYLFNDCFIIAVRGDSERSVLLLLFAIRTCSSVDAHGSSCLRFSTSNDSGPIHLDLDFTLPASRDAFLAGVNKFIFEIRERQPRQPKRS